MSKPTNAQRLTEALEGYDPSAWTVEPLTFPPFTAWVSEAEPSVLIEPTGILLTVTRPPVPGATVTLVLQVVLGHLGRFVAAHDWATDRFTAEQVTGYLAHGHYNGQPWYMHSSERLTLTKAVATIKEFAPGEVERRKAEESERQANRLVEQRRQAWEHYDAAVLRHTASMGVWLVERAEWVRWTSARMQSIGAPRDLADRVASDMASGAFWHGAPDGSRAGVREQPPVPNVPNFPRPAPEVRTRKAAGVTTGPALVDEAGRYRVNVFDNLTGQRPWWVWEVIDTEGQGRVVAGGTEVTEAEAERAVAGWRSLSSALQATATHVYPALASIGGWRWRVVDSEGGHLAGGREPDRATAHQAAQRWQANRQWLGVRR